MKIIRMASVRSNADSPERSGASRDQAEVSDVPEVQEIQEIQESQESQRVRDDLEGSGVNSFANNGFILFLKWAKDCL